MKNKMTTKTMVYIVALSTLAIIVGIFEIPLNFYGGKIDLSEVVILTAFLMLGFKNASIVIILRSLVRFFIPEISIIPTMTGSDPVFKLIGEVIAILASFICMLSYVLVKRILKDKQKPLVVAVPVTRNKVSIKTFILAPVITTLILTSFMMVFHTIFTMPLAISSYSHLTIFTFLKDPQYADQSLKGVIYGIIVSFTLMNVIKGVISPVIFLILKPRIEQLPMF